MKILLDECVDRRLAGDVAGHEVRTVHELGWAGTKNGELLKRAAETEFEAFITVDRNLAFQQNVATLPLAVVVLRLHDNRLGALKALVPELLDALTTLKPGSVTFFPKL